MSLSVLPPSWREIQRKNFISLELLADFLELTQEQRSQLIDRPRFRLNVPLRLAARMQKGSVKDPLFRQFVPLRDELLKTDGYVLDPVGDSLCRETSKLIHKYQGRVLLVCSSACVMHCRYCFRQNFDYATENKVFDDELRYITGDPSIHEVILSGGDPLSLSNNKLKDLIGSLEKIPHLKKLRFHSRFPIGIPERLDDELIAILGSTRLQVFFVIHCNHPHEIGDDLFLALARVQKLGIPVLNQTVLLRGVNDSVDILADLFENLTDRGVMPYYLHQLDPVQGAAHFAVPESAGRVLIEGLKKVLPGYAVPRYVREVPGESSKSAII
ncbi:MAG: KamA family radical SAM protein [Chlamydiales bacterium]|nr:KamA family radical SAM protein [Chlamydiales bacterium]